MVAIAVAQVLMDFPTPTYVNVILNYTSGWTARIRKMNNGKFERFEIMTQRICHRFRFGCSVVVFVIMDREKIIIFDKSKILRQDKFETKPRPNKTQTQ